MRIVCWQTILMKYHTLFVIFENAAKFEIVVCCKLYIGGALRAKATILWIVLISLSLSLSLSLSWT